MCVCVFCTYSHTAHIIMIVRAIKKRKMEGWVGHRRTTTYNFGHENESKHTQEDKEGGFVQRRRKTYRNVDILSCYLLLV